MTSKYNIDMVTETHKNGIFLQQNEW